MDPQPVTIVTFGFFKKNFTEGIAGAVKSALHCPVSLKEAHVDLGGIYDVGRRQYNGNELLKLMDQFRDPAAGKTIGLFSIDLFIPILTYIFGQAYLGGQTAIASTFRLGNERYGLPSNEGLLQERTVKEVVHELGHCFGLVHCHTPDCVMRSSTYVEDIDQKSSFFCADCRKNMTPSVSVISPA